ncbi:hypothetical protein CXB51_015248 [Gossypium anomalum]|uniref:Protein kinase domain-containing protein n=1 Tax=Gossypium anomalum TaxID=47600 RepID=A0A8J5Z127_9ROSI|nr:hypothetical protein CXB51_015248 [Gossypium anomalum]
MASFIAEDVVAVKKLWSRTTKDSTSEDQLIIKKCLDTEVETLGNIRHKNRPNRHQIALGVAQGLAYLHHGLLLPIIHRDIKSTILLDINYQPKVADFGIAKVLKDSTSTIIAGTYGYLAPEYAYSNKATTKCDVYSFGMVLMELITGKKPVDADFREYKNIVYWVTTKLDTKEGVMEVIDKNLLGSFKNEMIQTDPCLTDPYKFSTKTREASNVTENQSEETLSLIIEVYKQFYGNETNVEHRGQLVSPSCLLSLFPDY